MSEVSVGDVVPVGRKGVNWGGCASLPLSFGLICLIRTPIQTEIKPEPLVLLARGFVKLVLLLMADVVLHRTSSDEGILLLLSPRAKGLRAAASVEPHDAYYGILNTCQCLGNKGVSKHHYYMLVI